MNKKYFIYNLLMTCVMANNHFCAANTQYVFKAVGHARTQAPSGTSLLVLPKNPIKPSDIALVTGVTGGGAAVGYSLYQLNKQPKTFDPSIEADKSGVLTINSEHLIAICVGLAIGASVGVIVAEKIARR